MVQIRKAIGGACTALLFVGAGAPAQAATGPGNPQGTAPSESSEQRAGIDVWDAVSLGAPTPPDGDQGWFAKRAVAQEFASTPGRDQAASAGYWDGETLHFSSEGREFFRDRGGDVVMLQQGGSEMAAQGVELSTVPVDPNLAVYTGQEGVSIQSESGMTRPKREDDMISIGSTGNCSSPATTRTAKFGKVELCWYKYRAKDDKGNRDYWAYYGASLAKPHRRSSPRVGAYVANVKAGSEMGSAHKRKLGTHGFFDHWPRTNLSPKGCEQYTANVGGGIGPFNVGISAPITLCDKVIERTDAGAVAKSAELRVNTNKWDLLEKDHSVNHATITITGQRPNSAYQHKVSWTDKHSGRFCVTKFNCGNTN